MLDEIRADILALQKETEGLMEQIIGGGAAAGRTVAAGGHQ